MTAKLILNRQNFSPPLLEWFDQHGRKDLPWQQQSSPYQVWVSEIMLQQTQVRTVIPYYQRFIQKFPDINSLAMASTDDVLALWTGLGYYARARNLHKAACIIVKQHCGKLPDNLDVLIALPGIGRSTAGAIMALAYHQQFPILDGNVKRVLTRYDAVAGWPGNKAVEQQLWQRAEQLLPSHHIANYIQAQMDLGATICTRSKPNCTLCPLTIDCKAFKQGTQSLYPVPKPKKSVPTKVINWFVICHHDGRVLLEQRPPIGIWGGLWSFPESEIKEMCHSPDKQKVLPAFKHSLTHFKLDIRPILKIYGEIPELVSDNRQIWYTISDALKLGLPAPVKKILQSIHI